MAYTRNGELRAKKASIAPPPPPLDFIQIPFAYTATLRTCSFNELIFDYHHSPPRYVQYVWAYIPPPPVSSHTHT